MTLLYEFWSQAWTPRRIRLRAQKAEQEILRLPWELSRPSTEDKIAGESGMKVSEYRSFLEQYSRVQVAERELLVATFYFYERLTRAPLWPSVTGERTSVEQNFG